MKFDTSKQTIPTLIERSFIIASIFILFITAMAALYFNQKSLQEKRESNLQKIHQILSNLLIPEINVSNTAEIRRILQFASNQDEMFMVVDENGSILMPDYEKISFFKSAISSQDTSDCQSVQTFYRKINGTEYLITCSQLTRDDILSGSKRKSILLTFSKYKWLFFSPMMIYFIGIAILTLLLMVIWFRQILHRRLLQPLIKLGSRIEDMAKSPLTINPEIGDLGRAPREIISIKNAFETVLSNLQTEYYQRTESEKKAALYDLIVQLSHDIRSPLAVIEMTLLAYSKVIPQEEVNIQREAIQNVKNYFDNLLVRHREDNFLSRNLNNYKNNLETESQYIFLNLLIEQMISQKKREWEKTTCEVNYFVEPVAKLFCINAVPHDIKRILSNLFNNAYESMNDKKCINLKLTADENYLKLHIIDTGVGIAKKDINNVLNGLSLKHNGKGLGLSSSKRIMESIGGFLKLRSILGAGTEVILSFQKELNPTWFPDSIRLNSFSTIAILDDDTSMHSLWRQRLQGNNHFIHHFMNTHDFLNWYDKNEKYKDATIFLFDYELRDVNYNGFELLQKINAKHHGYLITSHAEEAYIQKQAEEAGIWLIPKSLIGDFPIQ